jgi:DNA-binding CsgD family transcriptional regulator
VIRSVTWGVPTGRGMSRTDAAAVVVSSAGAVALLALADPRDALCYLLAFPIWIVSRDLGAVAGTAVGAVAFLLFVVVGSAQPDGFGPLGYLAVAAVFIGAVAAGSLVALPTGSARAKRASQRLRELTAQPKVTRRPEALSPRELEILEAIATGAQNAEIADRFVISQNTVKSHVSRILQKLPAANRTEAAFRYIEMYGPPSSPEGDPPASIDLPERDRIGAATAVSATVVALRPKGEAVLRLQDGRDLEVPVIEQIRDRVDVGASTVAYFDQRDRVVGWYLPDQELGVDLRQWTP